MSEVRDKEERDKRGKLESRYLDVPQPSIVPKYSTTSGKLIPNDPHAYLIGGAYYSGEDRVTVLASKEAIAAYEKHYFDQSSPRKSNTPVIFADLGMNGRGELAVIDFMQATWSVPFEKGIVGTGDDIHALVNYVGRHAGVKLARILTPLFNEAYRTTSHDAALRLMQLAEWVPEWHYEINLPARAQGRQMPAAQARLGDHW